MYGIAFKKSLDHLEMQKKKKRKKEKKCKPHSLECILVQQYPFLFSKYNNAEEKKPVKISHYVVLHIMKATSDMIDVISQVAAEVWWKRCISEKFYCFAVYSVSWNVNKL